MNFIVPSNYKNIYTTYSQGVQITNILLPHIQVGYTITDATAGVGGNSKFFSKLFNRVNCVEIDKFAFDILKSNLNYTRNITYFNDNYLKIIDKLKQDIVFIDPPWGENYKSREVSIFLSGEKLENIINKLYMLCKIVVIKVPLRYILNGIKTEWSQIIVGYIHNKRNRDIYKIIIFKH